MRDIHKRIAKLEQATAGETPLVFVPFGSTLEEARAAWIAEHPDKRLGEMNFFISNVPEPEALPEEM